MSKGWRQVVVAAIGIGGLLLIGAQGFAAEDEGKEHGGTATQEHGGVAVPQAKEHGGATQEHGGTTPEQGGQALEAEPSAEQIRQTIRDYIELVELEEGVFTIEDDVTETARSLELVRVHERVGKTGDFYYSCTDMRDLLTDELLDLDFDVDASGDQLEVVDVRIHKLEGEARYTYDEHDNRIPLSPTGLEWTD